MFPVIKRTMPGIFALDVERTCGESRVVRAFVQWTVELDNGREPGTSLGAKRVEDARAHGGIRA